MRYNEGMKMCQRQRLYQGKNSIWLASQWHGRPRSCCWKENLSGGRGD